MISPVTVSPVTVISIIVLSMFLLIDATSFLRRFFGVASAPDFVTVIVLSLASLLTSIVAFALFILPDTFSDVELVTSIVSYESTIKTSYTLSLS